MIGQPGTLRTTRSCRSGQKPAESLGCMPVGHNGRTFSRLRFTDGKAQLKSTDWRDTMDRRNCRLPVGVSKVVHRSYKNWISVQKKKGVHKTTYGRMSG